MRHSEERTDFEEHVARTENRQGVGRGTVLSLHSVILDYNRKQQLLSAMYRHTYPQTRAQSHYEITDYHPQIHNACQFGVPALPACMDTKAAVHQKQQRMQHCMWVADNSMSHRMKCTHAITCQIIHKDHWYIWLITGDALACHQRCASTVECMSVMEVCF